MSKGWTKERKREHYYRQAKKAGYRSRAAFKLIQINDRHMVISPRNTVIDLGAAPGGWLQVAIEIVGPEGMVVGVDIQGIEPVEGVTFIRGDVTKSETVGKIQSIVTKADVIISDMSPNITGHYSMDHARSVELADKALEITKSLLKEGGNFVVKVFQGDLFNEYLSQVKSSFRLTKVHSPKASRKSSSEIYIIGKGFRGA